MTAVPDPAYGHAVDIDVLPSRADQVSGGDALVRVQAPKGLMKRLRVERNGTDVTVSHRRHHLARSRVVNHPITGPIFSGPQQARARSRWRHGRVEP